MEILKKDILHNTKKDFLDLNNAIEGGIKSLLIVGSKISQKTFDIKTIKSQIIVFLYSDMVETIEAAYNLCLQGYYECTAKLLRNSFEISFTIEKINSYKDEFFSGTSKMSGDSDEIEDYQKNKMSEDDKRKFELRLWFDGNKEFDPNKIRLFMRIFGMSKMIKDFSQTELLKENLEAYHKLSQFTHPSFQGMISRFRIKEGFLKFSASYKKEFAQKLLEDIFKSIILCGNTIKKIFPDLAFSKEESILLNSVGKKYDNLIL